MKREKTTLTNYQALRPIDVMLSFLISLFSEPTILLFTYLLASFLTKCISKALYTTQILSIPISIFHGYETPYDVEKWGSV